MMPTVCTEPGTTRGESPGGESLYFWFETHLGVVVAD